MNNRKKVLAVLGVVSVLFASFAMLVYAAAWTPDDMAAYMQNVGRHKIYQTNWILYNEIGPKMGQGLKGESAAGLKVLSPVATPSNIWSYTPPTANPKKVTFWMDLGNMTSGDSLNVWVNYDASPVDTVFNCSIDDTPSRKFFWTFNNEQTNRIKLIVDGLCITSNDFAVRAQWNSGGSVYIYFHAIIEEM